MGLILLMYLDILAWMEAANLLIVHKISKEGFYGSFVFGQY